MKRILVTGVNGYISRSFRQYMERFPNEYAVSAVSLRGEAWKDLDFSGYSAVLHTTGLAHVKETRENARQYYKINRDLTAEVAEKAKAEGVGQFVFLSSMSVYGVEEGVITPDSVPRPRSSYGGSKLEAEKLLLKMQTEDFRVAVLRPPMVYGEGCKGNYQALVRLAGILPVCPDYQNRRSMISIENLCEDIKRVIDSGADGIFCPQDSNYVCTCEMICEIARRNGRKIPRTKLLNFVPAILRKFTKKGKKAFGSLVYQDGSQRGHARV